MKTIAPEVGAIVEYGINISGKSPRTYRDTAYLCRVTTKPNFGDNWVGEMLFDSCREFKGSRMRWCIRSEATHLSLSGICCAIAPIEECRAIGMVDWPEKALAEARESAENKGIKAEMLY